MADISQITLPSNKVFNIKDASARQGLSTKVDIAQGVSNANKYLVTDENGNVITQDLPSDFLVVNVTNNSDIYTANKTAEEIYNHLSNGGDAICLYNNNIYYVVDYEFFDNEYLVDFVAYRVNTRNGNNYIAEFTFTFSSNEGISLTDEWLEPPLPSDSTPLADGTAAAGTSNDYARADHVHPSDTTKVDKNQGSANANKYLGTDSSGVVTLRDGYDLPIASPSTLGGVQPVEKTADMTQAVGVDANGLLYTNASAQSDWEEDDTTDLSHVLNRPAIRAGEGENSVMIGQIEPDEDAAIYTIYITGDAKVKTYSYTTTDTLPSTTVAYGYLACNDNNSYRKVTELTSNTITFSATYNTNALDNYEIKLYYNYKIALGKYSVTEGRLTSAIGVNAHAEGSGSRAVSNSAHAEGMNTYAGGISSHSEGSGSIALGLDSHAEGMLTIASSTNQHVQGKYNIEDASNTYADIVGNGTSSARSNAYTLDWNGNGWYAGKLTVGTGPTENMDVATKQYVDAATAGISPNLSGLADTNIASPATGQILTYDGTTSKWVNTNVPSYSLSINNNVITLTGSNGVTSSITLPVFGGTSTDVWEGGEY